MDAQIAPEPLNRVILQIAISAVQLQRLVNDGRAIVGRQPFGHGRKSRFIRRVFGDFGCCEIEQCARCFQIGGHICERELGVLKICDRLAKLLALFGISDAFIQASLRPAQRTCANVEAASVEAHHGYAKAFSFPADKVFSWNPHIF